MSKSFATPVPVFKLYGETSAWPTPDLIHCESIPERSKLHGWEIKPHRHSDLVQLLYVQAGQATLKVEDVINHIDSPSLQVVPTLSVHTFKFSEDIQGHVLSLAQPLAEQLSASLNSPVLTTAVCYPIGAGHLYLDTLFSAITQEYSQQQSGRDPMLQSLITVLSIWLGRRNLELSSPDALQLVASICRSSLGHWNCAFASICPSSTTRRRWGSVLLTSMPCADGSQGNPLCK